MISIVYRLLNVLDSASTNEHLTLTADGGPHVTQAFYVMDGKILEAAIAVMHPSTAMIHFAYSQGLRRRFHGDIGVQRMEPSPTDTAPITKAT